MMGLFRDRLRMRGTRGIIGLQRIFKTMDDDGSNCLNLFEFQKACRDYKIGISDEYLPTLFNAFDLNNNKTLDIAEFLHLEILRQLKVWSIVHMQIWWHIWQWQMTIFLPV